MRHSPSPLQAAPAARSALAVTALGAAPAAACALLIALSASPASAQLTFPNCPDLKAADFVQVPLVNNAGDATIQEPLKMAFDIDAEGKTEIWFTQRFGKLRKYSMAKKAMVTVADFAFAASQVPPGRNSYGLIGLALDPGFKQNRWIYLFLGFSDEWRIVRYTVNADKVDPAGGKVIFRFNPGPTAGLTHVAGALRFDPEGNLWATVSDNETPHLSANTNSYIGKIIRIKPKAFADAAAPAPGAGATYDVPAGNLYPMLPNGQPTARTLPEVYIMGVRNPYTLEYDPVRKAVAWGDIGPDVGQSGAGTEEFNLAMAPGNYGYPYWAGNQQPLEGGHGTPEAPINERADNTGLRELKPALAATLPYRRACAVTGPIYRYDGKLKDPARLPPHLDGKWIVSDFNLSWIDAVTLDAAGKVASRANFVPNSTTDPFDNPLEVQVGPDGVLYAVNYSGFRTWDAKTGLIRIEYRGNCHPVSTGLGAPLSGRGPAVRLQGLRLAIEEPGPHAVTLRRTDGTLARAWRGEGRVEMDLSGGLEPGVVHLEVETASGRLRRTVAVTR